jgi:uncharacterized protein
MPHKKIFFIALLISGSSIFPAWATDYKTIEWTDLLPDEDLELLLNMPAIDHGDLSDEEFAQDQPVDGLRAAEDYLATQVENAIAQAMGPRSTGERTWEDALVSTNVRAEFDGAKIRLPGFVVPLEFDDDMNISEFFLVPFFGACIHVPPPPPNQIIFVSYPQGLQLDALYTPFWVTGNMKVEIVENDMALSAYSMTAHSIIEYQED